MRSSSSTRGSRSGEDEWNDAWESAWLPEDLTAKSRAPWESDVNFPSAESSTIVSADGDADAETKAFVEEMTENWDERRKGSKNQQQQQKDGDGGLYSLENMKKDYRLKKQRIHAGLWMKEIEKQEEAKLGDSVAGGGDEIERLLDSCSEYVSFPLSLFCLQTVRRNELKKIQLSIDFWSSNGIK